MIIILDDEYYSLEDNGDGAGDGAGDGYIYMDLDLLN